MKEVKESRKTRYTRTALGNSLIEIMKSKPISKISVKEICERADINRTTFYVHYSDPYDLLEKIEAQSFLWVKEKIAILQDKQNNDESMKILEQIMNYIADNRSHMQVLLSQHGDIDFPAKLFTLVYEQCGIPKTGLAAKQLDFIFMVNGSVGLIQHWLKNDNTITKREMTETIHNMAVKILD